MRLDRVPPALRAIAVCVVAVIVGATVYVLLPSVHSDATASTAGLVPATSGNIVATARSGPLLVYAARGDTKPSSTLTPPEPGVPVVALVVANKGAWLHVLLPTRPNGSTGWVRASDVTQSIVSYHVTVSVHDHHLLAFNGTSLVDDTTVAVGTAATPTPLGRFFVTELLAVPDPSGPYGPYAFGLSGHSLVLQTFADGDGQLGLHGTNDPSVLGSDATHGCIRIANDDIRTLARQLPLGTPVDVVP
jgi:lipoprotein-anchoring transpeptidase ErfK/SrfK